VSQKGVWIASILLLLLATAVVVQGVDKEISRIDIVPEGTLTTGSAVDDHQATAPLDVNVEENGFFEAYRLERERTRGQEEETLTALINNPNASEDAKREAEHKLLQLTEVIEQELRIENMIRSMGFEQVIFFRKGEEANVVINAPDITEQQFLEIIQVVSQVSSVDPHSVNILQLEK